MNANTSTTKNYNPSTHGHAMLGVNPLSALHTNNTGSSHMMPISFEQRQLQNGRKVMDYARISLKKSELNRQGSIY